MVERKQTYRYELIEQENAARVYIKNKKTTIFITEKFWINFPKYILNNLIKEKDQFLNQNF